MTAGPTSLAARLLRPLIGRGTTRLLAGPRVAPEEAGLGPVMDALGGEIVRLRARDGHRLGGRWLPADRSGPTWTADPHEAILLLHGWSGSIAPDLVEYGPTLRRTAGVLGLDFRGHGESDPSPTTFGLREVEDVAGALAWLGERGITRVALVGTSMGGITALAAIVVLGDGSLAAADGDPDAPAAGAGAPRPAIVGAVAESVAPDLPTAVGNRLRLPFRRAIAALLFADAANRLGGDPRATEPGQIIGLIESVPLLLIHGAADPTVPVAAGRRLAARAGPVAEHWIVPGAGHSGARRADPAGWDERVVAFLRRAFSGARGTTPIIVPPAHPVTAPPPGGQEGD